MVGEFGFILLAITGPLDPDFEVDVMLRSINRPIGDGESFHLVVQMLSMVVVPDVVVAQIGISAGLGSCGNDPLIAVRQTFAAQHDLSLGVAQFGKVERVDAVFVLAE